MDRWMKLITSSSSQSKKLISAESRRWSALSHLVWRAPPLMAVYRNARPLYLRRLFPLRLALVPVLSFVPGTVVPYRTSHSPM